MTESTYKASCFCGSVEIETSGVPAMMGYFHCKDCVSWSAYPITAATLWPQESVKVVKGVENLCTFNKTEHTYRKFCRKCGGHLMADHPEMGLVDVYAAVLEDFPLNQRSMSTMKPRLFRKRRTAQIQGCSR